MSIPSELEYKAKYIKTNNRYGMKMYKCCDGPNCNWTKNLEKYPNDVDLIISFCVDHIKNPYNVLNTNVHNLELPTFNRENYKIINNKGSTGSDKIGTSSTIRSISDTRSNICGFRNCKEEKELKYMFHDYFCGIHCKEMMEVHAKYVDKNDIHGILVNKIKEFNYRKILNKKNIKDIMIYENLTCMKYLQIPINLVHYKYAYENLLLTEELTDKRGNLNKVSRQESNYGRLSLNSSGDSISNESPYRSESPVIPVKTNLSTSTKGNLSTSTRDTPSIHTTYPPYNQNNLRTAVSAYVGVIKSNRISEISNRLPEVTIKYKPINFKMHQNVLIKYDRAFMNNPNSYFSIDPVSFLKDPYLKV
jgi:hypothetical protein